MFKPLGNLVRQHVLAELNIQTGFVISFNDAFDWAADWAAKNAIEFHRLLPQA